MEYLLAVCPPGYSYLEKACNTGRGGGLAVKQKLELTQLPLSALCSFQCLAFKCKPPSYDNTPHLPVPQVRDS